MYVVIANHTLMHVQPGI